MEAATAAARAGRMRKPGGAGGRRPRKRARDNTVDLISKLPDDILGTIVSLLPTKDGARTQLIARRWRPLWRSAPLNICSDRLCSNAHKRISVVSKILSDHHGPTRRFALNTIRLHKAQQRFAEEAAQIESWFRSQALANLQELSISFDLVGKPGKLYPLPPSILLCASTLVVARISLCGFPKEITPSLSFPLLKQLNLRRVSISEDVFHGVLAGCHVLESLYLETIEGARCFCISSPTLRSVGLCNWFSIQGELVIEDAPRLQRLLLPDQSRLLLPDQNRAGAIRVIRAPKLAILGLLSPDLSELEIANVVFKSLTLASFKNMINTVKVLALEFYVPDFIATIDVLRCFPCLEKLYVNCQNFMIPVNVHQYDPTDPVKCLETHLKELVLKDYEGSEQDISFAKFFVLNAEVLKKIRLAVIKKISKKWVAHQYMLLEVGIKASRDVQVEFVGSNYMSLDAHDLSTADPFASCYFQME